MAKIEVKNNGYVHATYLVKRPDGLYLPEPVRKKQGYIHVTTELYDIAGNMIDVQEIALMVDDFITTIQKKISDAAKTQEEETKTDFEGI